MARNRMIRPELWSSEEFAELSAPARLLYIGLPNFCDDGGNHPASAKAAKMEIFPGDDITAQDVAKWMTEIIAQGLITPYTGTDKREYWHISKWNELQKIERPSYKYPKFAEHSPTDPQPSNDRSGTKEKRKEEKRKEEKRKEEKRRESAPAHEENFFSSTADIIDAVTAHLRNDDWASLAHICEQAGYDPAQLGPVRDEVKKFCTHHAERMARDPVTYFREKFLRWLIDAKQYNKPRNGNGNGSNARPYSTAPPGKRTGPQSITQILGKS